MKFNSIVVGLVFALLASVSFANQATLFRGSSGDGWSAFEQDLQKENLIKNGAFPTAVLTQIAYAHAKGTNLPAGALGEKEFKTLFLLANNFGETITVSEFRTLGQAGKIVLPDMAPRTATTGTEASATPVAVAPVTPQVAPPDGRQAIALSNMEAQVKALQAEVAKSGNTSKEVAAFSKRLTEVSGQLSALKNGQAGFVTKAESDAQKKALALLQDEVNKLANLRSELDGIKSTQTQIEGRMSAVEQNPILAMGNKLFAAFGLLVLLVLVYAIVAWKRVTNVKMIAEKATATAETASSDVAVLHAEIGRLDIVIPDSLELQLRAMPENDEMLVTVKVEGDAKVLRFTKTKDGVKIEGIDSQPEHLAVRIENVRKRIKKAAGARDLVGLKNGVDAVNAQPLRAVG